MVLIVQEKKVYLHVLIQIHSFSLCSLGLCGALEHFGYRAPSLTEFGYFRRWSNLDDFKNWFVDKRGGHMDVIGYGLTGDRLLQPVYSDTSDSDSEEEMKTFSSSAPDVSLEPAETSFISPVAKHSWKRSSSKVRGKGGAEMDSFASSISSLDIFSPRPRTYTAFKRKATPVPSSSLEIPKVLKDLATEYKEIPSISGPTLPPKIARVVTVPMLKARLGTLPMGNLSNQKKAISDFVGAVTPRVTRQSARRIVSKSPPTYRSRSPSPAGNEEAME